MFRSYQDMVRTPKQAKYATPEIYNCNMCDKGGWHTENDVEIHKKETHFLQMHAFKARNKDRFCTICMTIQESNEDLIEHIKSQHLLSSPKAKRVERKIYICNDCTHIFFNKDVLSTHMLYVHLTKKSDRKNTIFTCPKCNKNCLLKSIWFHFQKHDIPSVSMCDICLVNFPSRLALHKHVETHKGYFKCEPCGYNSSQESSFEIHLQVHEQRKIPHGKVSLEVLNSVFTRHKNSFTRYNVHNTLKGLNLPRFIDICTLCREICVGHAEAKRHVLRDHMCDEELEKKKHLCVCGEEFYYKVVLKQHVMKKKGLHRSIEEASVPDAGLLPTKGKLSFHRKKLLVKNNSSMEDQNRGLVDQNRGLVDQNRDVVELNKGLIDQINAFYAQNEVSDELKPEVKNSDMALLNLEAPVDKVDMSNKIEVEISNPIITPMECNDDADENAMAASVANSIKHKSTS